MPPMKIFALILGIAAMALGGLWLVQGLGLVVIPPIFCVAECAPLEGPSPMWTLIGLGVAAAGGAAIRFALRRRAGGG